MSSQLPNLAALTTKRAATRGVVLIADDEPTVLRLAELMFQQMGFAALTASNGRDAMSRLNDHLAEIRIVMLDLTMPDMDGVETLAAIRAIRPAIPVIVCSGHSSESIPSHLLTDEHNRFLAKPYPFRELERLVNSLLPEPK